MRNANEISLDVDERVDKAIKDSMDIYQQAENRIYRHRIRSQFQNASRKYNQQGIGAKNILQR